MMNPGFVCQVVTLALIAFPTASLQENPKDFSIERRLAIPIRDTLPTNVGEAISAVCKSIDIAVSIPDPLFKKDTKADLFNGIPVSAKACLTLLLQNTGYDILICEGSLKILGKVELRSFVYKVEYDLDGYDQDHMSTLVDRIKVIIRPNSWHKPRHRFSLQVDTIREVLVVECTRIVHSQVRNFVELEGIYIAQIRELRQETKGTEGVKKGTPNF